jgi:hypothetical protein
MNLCLSFMQQVPLPFTALTSAVIRYLLPIYRSNLLPTLPVRTTPNPFPSGKGNRVYEAAKPVPVSEIARRARSSYTSIPACTTVGPSLFGIFGSRLRFIAFSIIGAIRSAF